MKWQLILALGGTLHRVAGLELIGEQEQDNGVICYTYLSTYLAPVDVAITGKELPTAANFPTTRGILPPYFTNRSTSLPSFKFSSSPESSNAIQKPTSIYLFSSSDFVIPSSEPSSLLPPTTATSTEASATTTGAVSGQNVIFFIAPPANENRRFIKRAPGRFVGGSDAVEICANAAVFTLADGQLLDNEDPVYYNGNSYEQFGGQGSPPDGAITREFASVNGVLLFSSPSLPGNSAGFCQDDSGQVYMTFGSSSPGCDPISIRVYAVERCQNGQIIGLDTATTTEPNQSTIAEPTSIASSDTETFPFDPSATTLVVSSASTQISQSSDLSPETIETTQSSRSTQIFDHTPSSAELSSFSFAESSSEEPTTTSDMFTTTTEQSTTATEEPTATTTTLCNSVDPLTKVALANPTPVFNDDRNHRYDYGVVTLPWGDNGLLNTGENTIFITTNGVITVDAPNTGYENVPLTTSSQVNRAFLPCWDELYLDRSKGHTIVYEIFEGRFGVELVVEFILGKFDSPGIYHFEANFLRDSGDQMRFQYYTTPEKGSSATVGFQNLLTGRWELRRDSD
ncbi:hypothetical protein HYE67_005209 [Fusarium culmorum]|uniref:DUF7908 domain-containing protein n=1 Tax=Fusarium culmorum TaxID=5516 RepID=A0A7S8HVN9_FUSCU|nr:hypothetical protein HYE67_005209 [Fusarium culmorum]